MRYLYRLLFVTLCSVGLVACGGTNNDEAETEMDSQEEDSVEEANQEDEVEATSDDSDTEREEEESKEPPEDPEAETEEVVMENEAFQIEQPSPGTVVEDLIVVKGFARVFEGTVQYEFEDGHFILDEGFTTASAGGPEWGAFEITIPLGDAPNGEYRIVIYEESAKDGSKIHELMIPVEVDR